MSILLPFLTVLCAFATVGWAVVVYWANMMSDAPTRGLQFGRTILIPLALTAFFGFCWWHG